MKFEWDEQKRNLNLLKHGLDFAIAWKLWEFPMIVIEDKRKNYNELRYIGMGLLEGRVTVVVYTELKEIIRVISFRKANNPEVKFYEKVIWENSSIFH